LRAADQSAVTGSVAIKDGEFHYRRPRYIKRISASWPPWRWKILLRMEDGTEVCTIDTSRFGRIRAVDAQDAISVPPLSLLARDAWLDLPSVEDLRADLTCRAAPIKTVLLDQNAAVSGLGNYNVDEVLFHARIHPRQPSYTLDMKQTVALHSAIELVAAKVMEIDADTKKLPKTWLYKHRYGRKNGVGQVFTMVNFFHS
jgi:formamidopyrimidine-DNA glycosylase